MSPLEQLRTDGASVRSANSPATRFATRCAFLAAGFGLACWAPLVPYAKARLQVDDGTLGILMLLLGIGSVVAMPLTGILSARLGSKWIIIGSALGIAATLPFLAIAGTSTTLGLALFAFGASLGSLDVAMNVHAVEVEKASRDPLMSGFHALFSVGGFLGSASATVLLSGHLDPGQTAMCDAVVVAVLTAAAWPFLLVRNSSEQKPLLVMPHGIVLLLSALSAVVFLVEGALLDWSALLIIDSRFVAPAQGGLGYMLFTVAMTLGRLTGDRLASRFGGRRLLVWGGIVAIAGVAILLEVPIPSVAMAGFVLIGLGAANIVPVLFRQAGAQTIMPPGLAVAALTTVGYAGVLAGPASIGFVAHLTGLHTAFWLLAGLLCLIPMFARAATPNG